jgi:hypothetical protein
MIEALKSTKWLDLKMVTDPKNGVIDYVYSHEVCCNGKKIVVLPYRITKGNIEFLLRSEITPCWNLTKNVICSITGSVESGEPIDTVLAELREEAGYITTEEEIVFLSTMFGIKSSDTTYYIYTIDLSGREEKSNQDKGINQTSFCFWTKNINQSEDPFVYSALIKTLQYCKKKGLKFKVL